MHYEVTPSKGAEDEWRVEGIDYDQDGQVYVSIFSGPGAQVRAKEYALFKNSDWTLHRARR